MRPGKRGKLSKGQLRELAAVLAKYDLLSMELPREGIAGAPPGKRLLGVQFGTQGGEVILDMRDPLPGSSTANPPERLAGILREVTGLLEKASKEEEDARTLRQDGDRTGRIPGPGVSVGRAPVSPAPESRR
jgi:hypothetical protein